jgi:hypothetical protein
MRKETVLQVFVGSPSDTGPERVALRSIIDELNNTWSRTNGIRLELVSWETRVHPDVGVDAQSAINDQIGDEYDVFVCVLWSRIGTATDRFESGTFEEFERALTRLRSGARVKLLTYFKTAPIAPDAIDIEQLGGVQRFRKRLQDEGVLYSTFVSTDDFEGLLRLHLSLLLQDWRADVEVRSGSFGASPLAGTSDIAAASAEPAGLPEDEYGFIDLIEMASEHLEALTANANRIVEATTLVGNQVNTRAEALRALGSADTSAGLRAYKRVTNLAADDLAAYATRLRSEIPTFAEHYQRAIEAFGAAVSIAPEIDRSEKARVQLEEAVDVMTGLIRSLTTSRESMAEFRDVVATLPRMTTAFNRSRRLAVTVLEEFLASMNSAIEQTKSAEVAGRRLLQSEGQQ